MSEANCIQYADDTVVFVAHQNLETINETLNNELCKLQAYFRDNELILNLKKGKTETVLFGTVKLLSKQTRNSLSIEIDGVPVHHVDSYVYLGNQLDSKLNLNDNFDKAYKKATGRLNLLTKLRSFLNFEAAYNIFEMVIAPIVLYSSLIHLQLTSTQKRKLQSLSNRAEKIVGGNLKIKGIGNRMLQNACNFVKQCLDGKSNDNFNDYFQINKHTKLTRNGNKLLKLPSIKLEFGKKSFRFQGAKIFNNLPLEIRESEDAADFRKRLAAHF